MRLEHATVALDDRVVLTDVTWHLAPGDRWALWGPNGAGKTTLLGVLAGRIALATGSIVRAPGTRIGSVGADPTVPDVGSLGRLIERGWPALAEAERALRAEERRLADGGGDLDRYAALQERFDRSGGYGARSRLRAACDRLLPGRDDATPIAALDAGERRRLALALAFLDRPDLLLLDEPSRRLDAPARAWLVQRLTNLPDDVTVVLASHDRELLGAVTTGSAHLAAGRVDPRRVPFDVDRERRGAVRRSAAERARRAAREARRLASAADLARRHGSPSRAAAARNLTRRAERHAAAADAALREASRQAVDATPATLELGRDASDRDASGPLLRARGLHLDGRFDELAFDLEAGEKVVLLGRDGSGASALLAQLAAAGPRPARSELWLRPGARVAYWDPERRGLAADPVRAQLRRWVSEPRADALLALVGLPHDRWDAPPDRLSQGQRGRAALALLLAAEPDLALIDRPEDDLDLAALEQVEQALVDARTAVVLFTHDLRLAAAVATDVRSFEQAELVAWRGGVDGWKAGRRRREATVRAGPHDGGVGGRATPEGATFRRGPSAAHEAGDASAPDALEEAQAAIEALLEDPLRLGDRERRRLEARVHALVEARMQAYDAVLPRPAPRYHALEPPLELAADVVDGRLVFHAPNWPKPPVARTVDDVVHLVLPEPDAGCWTEWARIAALRACLAIVVPLFAPTAVQTPAGRADAPAPFVALDDAWWIASRDAWERWSGWR